MFYVTFITQKGLYCVLYLNILIERKDIMKNVLISGATVASIMMSGCGSNNDTSNATTGMNNGDTMSPSQRLTKMTMAGDTVEQDNQTKLCG